MNSAQLQRVLHFMQRKSWVGRIKNSECRVREQPNPTWKTCLFFVCVCVCDMHAYMHVFACVWYACLYACFCMCVCTHMGDTHTHLWVFWGISFHSSSTLFTEAEDRKQIQSFLIWLVLVSPFSGAWNTGLPDIYEGFWGLKLRFSCYVANALTTEAISLALEELTVTAHCISELLWIGHSFCSASLLLGTGTYNVLSLPVY